MSRRRGEFEHRTSIFEGAFRAWSHLGGIEPHELESKTLQDLDPLNSIAEDKAKSDPRLEDLENNEAAESEGNGKRRLYPYEPLPRTGLSHPFVQAILSPWLGPEAEQNAINLGLTTLRTWWQHRRKGESGSAISALGTDKMRGVVEGYTRHFFSLAYCLVTNDGEQPPRTLMQKMKTLEKARAKKHKKRAREEEAGKLAALALNAGLAHGLNVPPAEAANGGTSPEPNTNESNHENAQSATAGLTGISAAEAAALEASLTPLEKLALNHQRQQQQKMLEEGRVPGVLGGNKCLPGKLDLNQLALQMTANVTQIAHRGAAMTLSTSLGGYGNTATPDGLTSSSAMAQIMGSNAQMQGMGSVSNSKSGAHSQRDSSDDPDSDTTPVVFVSQNGDIQIAMSVEGITCAHCVKIVETVLKGCNGNKSPINGLLDAAADHQLCSVIIKVDKSSNAKRIAKEAARNLAMVGYTAKAKEMDVDIKGSNCCSTSGSTSGSGGKMDLGMLSTAFAVVAATDPKDVFDWDIPCTCPDNGVLREDCQRHSQMNSRIFEAFNDREKQVAEYVSNCGKKAGGDCNCGTNCACGPNCRGGSTCASKKIAAQQAALAEAEAKLAAQQAQLNATIADHAAIVAAAQQVRQAEEIAHMHVERASRSNSISSYGRRRFSTGSEMTFGRAMSGLSALSIDWENMEDFDVNVDHSSHINNSYAQAQAQSQSQSGEERNEAVMQGCAMIHGGECNCGPTCFCVGCPIHDKPNSSGASISTIGTNGPPQYRRKRSSLRVKPAGAPVDTNMQVSFKM